MQNNASALAISETDKVTQTDDCHHPLCKKCRMRYFCASLLWGNNLLRLPSVLRRQKSFAFVVFFSALALLLSLGMSERRRCSFLASALPLSRIVTLSLSILVPLFSMQTAASFMAFHTKRAPCLRRLLASSSGRSFFSSSTALKMTSGHDILSSFSPSQKFIGQNVAAAMESLANANAVCFDVDSTVISEEGIDVLAEYLGKHDEVAELTRKAMEGTTKFQDALQARLELLKPSKKSIEECLEQMPLQLTPGVESFIESLHESSIDVYLVSGGFRIMIQPIAKQLCVAKTNIFANTILFDNQGNYAGFDAKEPTSADMGKRKALEMIKEQGGYDTMVMIGDGATDAQAKPPANAFIGFGGVVERQAVKDKACWFVTDFADLEQVVQQFATKKRV